MANYNRSPFLDDLILNKSEKKKQYHYSFFRDLIVTSIFWIIGIIFLISGYHQTKEANKIINQGNKVMAIITNVHEYEEANADGSYSNERDVTLSYMANNQKYDYTIEKANIYNSVGEKTEIYYDSNDPTNIISSEHLNNKVSFQIPMGIALCVFALFLHIASWLISKKNRSK